MNSTTKDYIYLSVLWLFHASLNIWFVFKDIRPPSWDQSRHLITSSRYIDLLASGKIIDAFQLSDYYPPFVHVLASPLSFSYDAATCINILFLGILLFSVYGIGKTLFSREVGILSVLIISFYPYLISVQRDFLLDFGLVAMFSASLYVLLKTNNFKSLKYSILFGMAFGLSLLAKWTSIIFLIGPVFWVLYKSYTQEHFCASCGDLAKRNIRYGTKWFCSKEHRLRYKKSHKRLILGGATSNILLSICATVITACWYLPNFTSVIRGLLRCAISSEEQWSYYLDLEIFSFKGLTYYITGLNEQIYLFFIIVFLIGIFYLRKNNYNYFFLLSLLVPFIFFSLTRAKDARFVLLTLIFISIISAAWIAKLKNKKIKCVIVLLILVVGIMQVSTITFGTPSFETKLYPAPILTSNDDWKVEDIINVIKKNINNNETQRLTVIVIPDRAFLNGLTYKYYGLSIENNKWEDKCLFLNGAYISGPKNDVNYLRNWYEENMLDIDYFIDNIGYVPPNRGYGKRVTIIRNIFSQHSSAFTEIAKFELPDKTHVVLYKNNQK